MMMVILRADQAMDNVTSAAYIHAEEGCLGESLCDDEVRCQQWITVLSLQEQHCQQ